MATISVLYVEDDEDEFIIMSQAFKNMAIYSEEDDFVLTWAKNIIEGIAQYLSGKFDVCLLDFRLGNNNAHDFFSCIQQHMSCTPVIVYTSRDELTLDIHLMESGARAFVPKSVISPQILERTIRHVLHQFKQNRNSPVASWDLTGKKSLLCIDDDHDDYEILQHRLSNIKTANYQSRHIPTLQAGLEEYLGENHYDICLLDYKLGKHTALEMLFDLGEDVHRIPIIMITDCNDPVLDRFAMELGVIGFLRKSEMTVNNLEQTLRYAIHYSSHAAQ